jgi:hypothetical protein
LQEASSNAALLLLIRRGHAHDVNKPSTLVSTLGSTSVANRIAVTDRCRERSLSHGVKAVCGGVGHVGRWSQHTYLRQAPNVVVRHCCNDYKYLGLCRIAVVRRLFGTFRSEHACSRRRLVSMDWSEYSGQQKIEKVHDAPLPECNNRERQTK